MRQGSPAIPAISIALLPQMARSARPASSSPRRATMRPWRCALPSAATRGPEPNFLVCRAGALHGSSAILAVVDLSAHFRALAQGAVLKFAVILGEFHERSGSAAYRDFSHRASLPVASLP